MSLLLDALKQAEEAKRRAAAGVSADTNPVPTPPTEAASESLTLGATAMQDTAASASEAFPSLALEPISPSPADPVLTQPEARALQQPSAATDTSPLTTTPATADLLELTPEPGLQPPQTPAEPPQRPTLSFTPPAALPEPSRDASVPGALDFQASADPESTTPPQAQAPTPSAMDTPGLPKKSNGREAPAFKPVSRPIDRVADADQSRSPPATAAPQPGAPTRPKAPRSHDRRRIVGLVGAAFVVILAMGLGWVALQLRTPAPLAMVPQGMDAGASAPTTNPVPQTAEVVAASQPALSADPAAAVAAAGAKLSQPASTHTAPSQSPAPPGDTLHAPGMSARQASAEAASPPRTPGRGDRAAVVAWHPQPGQSVHIERTRSTPSVPTEVEQGYAAYTRGDWAAARRHYQRQLAVDPLQRDALLGLAAVARQQGQLDEARALYMRLTQQDPTDALAIASLAALETDRDPRAAEIRLRTLANRTPEAVEGLAQMLARQGRWSEAQPYFFQAYNARPEDADAAYNLAVALDQLNQSRLAADYYEKALRLAQPGHRFDRELARQRVEALRAP